MDEFLSGEIEQRNRALEAELHDVWHVLDSAPILSQFHGDRGFKTNEFVQAYEAWRASVRDVRNQHPRC